MTGAAPCSPAEAVQRALSIIGKGGQYVLGTGDYRPHDAPDPSRPLATDLPWTQRERDGLIGSDCAGFAISWCYKLRRHRPGYNKGGKFDVEDDINNNAILGDAFGARECFELAAGMPLPGDLLVYPTFRLASVPQPFIGHVGICVSAAKVTSWDAAAPRYDLLDVAQCRGPDRRSPAVLLTDGSIWQHHRDQWEKPEQTVYLLRAVG